MAGRFFGVNVKKNGKDKMVDTVRNKEMLTRVGEE